MMFLLMKLVASITDRDERDKKRMIAPLVVPENAIVVDTSDLTIQQTVEKMMKYINDYLPSEL